MIQIETPCQRLDKIGRINTNLSKGERVSKILVSEKEDEDEVSSSYSTSNDTPSKEP